MSRLAPKSGFTRAVVAAVVVVLALLTLAARQSGHPPERTIAASGVIEAEEVRIPAQRAARVEAFEAAEGQAVRKGDVVAVLDTSELRAQLTSAEGAAVAAAARLEELLRGSRSEEVRIAAAQVETARAGVQGAERTLGNARLDYRRRTSLRQTLDAALTGQRVQHEAVQAAAAALQGAEETLKTAQEEHDTSLRLRLSREQAREQGEAARAALRGAQAELDRREHGTRAEVLAAGEARLAQAEAALRAAREERENAAADLRRYQSLFDDKALAAQALDAAKTRAQVEVARAEQAVQARAEAAAALAELRAGPRPEEREVARAGLASARASLAGAEVAVRHTRTAYDDSLLQKQGVDTALQQYQAALGELEAAAAGLDLRRSGARAEQLARAQGELKQAQGELALARAQFAQSVIRAPRDGVIARHVAKAGEAVNPGSTVAKLLALDEVYLTLYVPLAELGKVRVG